MLVEIENGKQKNICEISIDFLTFCKKSGIIIVLVGTLHKRVPTDLCGKLFAEPRLFCSHVVQYCFVYNFLI
jgi:hypothetical protein